MNQNDDGLLEARDMFRKELKKIKAQLKNIVCEDKIDSVDGITDALFAMASQVALMEAVHKLRTDEAYYKDFMEALEGGEV